MNLTAFIEKFQATRFCEVCQSPLSGRADKRFCNINCKNIYHQTMRSINRKIAARIDQFLRRNRTILYELYAKNETNEFTIKKWKLHRMGFKFQYHTGSYIGLNNDLYYHVYDFSWKLTPSQDVLIVKQ